VIEKLADKFGFYAFCFGEYDSILITQFPDPTSAAAGPIAASAAGTVARGEDYAAYHRRGGDGGDGQGRRCGLPAAETSTR
jgi:hypothetical protein